MFKAYPEFYRFIYPFGLAEASANPTSPRTTHQASLRGYIIQLYHAISIYIPNLEGRLNDSHDTLPVTSKHTSSPAKKHAECLR